MPKRIPLSLKTLSLITLLSTLSVYPVQSFGRSFRSPRQNPQVHMENFGSILRRYNLRCLCEKGKYRCFNGSHYLIFTVGNREMNFDGIKVFLSYPVTKSLFESNFSIASVDVQFLIKPLLSPGSLNKHLGRGSCIVIDPGHGGKADGCVNHRLKIKEKDINLRTARALKTALQAQGYRVFLTRDKDVDIGLQDRSAFANRLRAQLFISIHYNSAENSPKGAETFACTFPFCPSTGRDKLLPSDRIQELNNPFDKENTYLAYCVQEKLVNTLKSEDRGLRHARFAVLRHVRCPAILIECGYLTNDQEARKMLKTPYQEKLVSAIVAGVQRYARGAYSTKPNVSPRLDKMWTPFKGLPPGHVKLPKLF